MTDRRSPRARAARRRRPASAERPCRTCAAAAAAAGLLDVAYATLDSPVGPLLLAATPRGLVRLAYLDDGDEDASWRTSPRASRRASWPRRAGSTSPGASSTSTSPGARRRFEIALDWQLTPRLRPPRAARPRPRSPTARSRPTRQVAAAAGSPRGSRAAGNALGANPLPIVVPCHRVLHTGGGLGGYTGGLERKRMLLAIESGQAPPA